MQFAASAQCRSPGSAGPVDSGVIGVGLLRGADIFVLYKAQDFYEKLWNVLVFFVYVLRRFSLICHLLIVIKDGDASLWRAREYGGEAERADVAILPFNLRADFVALLFGKLTDALNVGIAALDIGIALGGRRRVDGFGKNIAPMKLGEEC